MSFFFCSKFFKLSFPITSTWHRFVRQSLVSVKVEEPSIQSESDPQPTPDFVPSLTHSVKIKQEEGEEVILPPWKRRVTPEQAIRAGLSYNTQTAQLEVADCDHSDIEFDSCDLFESYPSTPAFCCPAVDPLDYPAFSPECNSLSSNSLVDPDLVEPPKKRGRIGYL